MVFVFYLIIGKDVRIIVYMDKVVKNFKLIESSEGLNENVKTTLTMDELKRFILER